MLQVKQAIIKKITTSLCSALLEKVRWGLNMELFQTDLWSWKGHLILLRVSKKTRTLNTMLTFA